MIIITAVPLPFRMSVLSIKHSKPMKSAGTILCKASCRGGTSTTSQSVTAAKSKVMIKQII